MMLHMFFNPKVVSNNLVADATAKTDLTFHESTVKYFYVRLECFLKNIRWTSQPISPYFRPVLGN